MILKSLGSIWPSIVWTSVIFLLLSMSTDGLGGNGLFGIPGLDKVIHFTLFGAFVFLWGSYYSIDKKYSPSRLLLILILVASLYGLGMEYYQRYFTNRSFSLWDALADTIGSIAGAWAVKKSPYGNRGRNQN